MKIVPYKRCLKKENESKNHREFLSILDDKKASKNF